ncbi:MAG: hypothetical protein LBJ41_04440 [Treponema sp.]|jgi:hypothetical protein|nr:hypothetical protein [Treponema sp.]
MRHEQLPSTRAVAICKRGYVKELTTLTWTKRTASSATQRATPSSAVDIAK